jgi:hypothetical protein
MDSDNGVRLVVLTRQKHPDLRMLNFLVQPIDFALQIRKYVFSLHGQLQKRLQIRSLTSKPGVQLHVAFETAPQLERALSFVLASPELGLRDLLLEFRYVCPPAIRIKDNLGSGLFSRR